MILEGRRLKRVVGDRVLFEGLDLSVSPGEVVAVRGPSGAGKTLLLRTLAWLDPLDAGEVTLGGKTPAQLGVPVWRTRVCWVPQRPAALPGTPLDYVHAVSALAAQAGREGEDPRPLAEQWGLPATAWDQPWTELSGGERQRVVLAVSLCRRPDVLLLDEPTSALDPDAVAKVEASLKGQTLVWVTHDAGQCDRVADRIVEVG